MQHGLLAVDLTPGGWVLLTLALVYVTGFVVMLCILFTAIEAACQHAEDNGKPPPKWSLAVVLGSSAIWFILAAVAMARSALRRPAQI